MSEVTTLFVSAGAGRSTPFGLELRSGDWSAAEICSSVARPVTSRSFRFRGETLLVCMPAGCFPALFDDMLVEALSTPRARLLDGSILAIGAT